MSQGARNRILQQLEYEVYSGAISCASMPGHARSAMVTERLRDR